MVSQLEYRANLITDAVVQPCITAGVEVALWSAIFVGAGISQLGGRPVGDYLAYALWAAFFSRATANWMYEFRMVNEIDTGSVNAILVRPISFFEYYLGQFMGYKFLTGGISFIPPLLCAIVFQMPVHFDRVVAAVGMSVFYLFFVHTLSFAVASLAFFFNRTHMFTVAKNIIIGMLTGEIIPLDLAPAPFKDILIALPFSSSVFLPVGYITGRVNGETFARGFISIGVGIMVAGLLSTVLWNSGRKRYSGTGA
jgi:ABC-2 type transport system permease protein